LGFERSTNPIQLFGDFLVSLALASLLQPLTTTIGASAENLSVMNAAIVSMRPRICNVTQSMHGAFAIRSCEMRHTRKQSKACRAYRVDNARCEELALIATNALPDCAA
jgi:hypothetical protein